MRFLWKSILCGAYKKTLTLMLSGIFRFFAYLYLDPFCAKIICMTKADGEYNGISLQQIGSYGTLLPYVIIPFRIKSAKVLFRFLRTVVRDFFFLQFSVKLGLKKIPIIDVSHPLDDSVPFDPEKIHTYLDFIDFWIRPMTFLFKRFGVKKTLPYCIEYLSLIDAAYTGGALIYRFCMTTTKRPDYKANASFRLIHALDPHLLCVPSLHVAVATLVQVYYKEVFADCGLSTEEQQYYSTELEAGARKIIESVLYVKQHSVNCIPAALYMLLSLLKGRFTIGTAVDIINSLFCDVCDITEKDKKLIRGHIHFMFERLLLEGANEDDWTVPVKRWLKSYTRQKS